MSSATRNPKTKDATTSALLVCLPLQPSADSDCLRRTLPWDLRLLRCCDEFRSLRTLRHCALRSTLAVYTPFVDSRKCAVDRKVNYDAVLRYFQANINRLRSKYGRQPLRGYDPDEGLDEEDEEGEQQDDDDDDGKAAEDVEGAKIEEIVERTEEDWASTVFALGRLAKFFDNRANDKCVAAHSRETPRSS